MSQPLLLIPTPLAITVQDWLVVLDSAIQSDSNDDKAVTKAKYDKRQHQKKVQKDQKVAEEAVAQERVEAECWEREVAELSLAEGSQGQGGPQADHMTCAWCTKAKVNCTYELAKATSTKKVWKCIVLAESMSPRASEKKKCACAKSLEVEVVGGSLQAKKGKSVTHNTLITGGQYAISTAIDWHTKEMVQLQQMVKMLGSLHHHMIKSMAELLQEMMYPELELPASQVSGGTSPSFKSEGEYHKKNETEAERQNDTGNIAKYKVLVLQRDKPEVYICTRSDQTESKMKVLLEMASSVGSWGSLYKGMKGVGGLDITARAMKRTWAVGSGASLKAPESTWRGVGSGSAQGRGDLGGNEDVGGDVGRGVG
ncbi:hypothetical protein EDD16DRAFT_1523603 [Pisolithus croceorrhizus]|nr:hypothetical protein EV401DRAFT_1896287 [Pisolithus croceorrhizus]KAI6106814.1 hypothetical protein EDD16DRAFT_1523603 [Pisolithus croceorrhizus]